MRVLLSFALEMEFAPWRRRRAFTRVGPGPASFRGRAGESDLRVLLTGVGPEAARRVARQVMQEPADVCIVCGLAGSLKQGHKRGDILASSTVREAESQRIIESDASLLDAAVQAGAISSAICTSSYIAATAEDKRRMTGLGDAVDMESFAVMEQAHAKGIPAIAIRAISDLVDEELPGDLANTVNPDGSIRYWRTAAAVLKAPTQLPKFARLGLHSHYAAGQLAKFLDLFMSNFSNGAIRAAANMTAVSGNS